MKKIYFLYSLLSIFAGQAMEKNSDASAYKALTLFMNEFSQNYSSTTKKSNKTGAILDWVKKNEFLIINDSLSLPNRGITNLDGIEKILDPSNILMIDRLNFSHNYLGSLPITLFQFKNLKELDLRDNKLSCLPDNLGDLKELELADFSENNLTELPQSIGRLKKLITLRISHNKIKQLPWLINNKELKFIWAANNCLTTLYDKNNNLIIPDNVRYIDVRGNQLDAVLVNFVDEINKNNN